MRFKGLTKRWLINGLSMILLVLVLMEVGFGIGIHAYYYQLAESSLYSRAKSIADTINTQITAGSFRFESSTLPFVENFADKEKMELQLLDSHGKVIASSTGFLPADTTPGKDFLAAVRSISAADTDATDTDTAKTADTVVEYKGAWSGRDKNGEPISALTVLVMKDSTTMYGALRYVTSMSRVDGQIWLLISILVLFGLLILFFVMMSSSYFVSSIVNPVGTISQTARRIALGDYDCRIEKEYDDEIGDLCDTINYMAGEISAADKLQSEFISSVSHELRTPLTAIKGWSETLEQGGAQDPELLAKGLDVINTESERLSGMVEELLDFSRLQGGRLTMTFSRMDVLAELEEAVVLFKDRAQREGMTISYADPEQLPPIMGDHDRIKQCFINILDNAIKYSHPGGRIRVDAAAMGRRVQVVISDDGVGISAKDLPHIREKFYKANHTRPGSGIGLALVDEIIRRHNGRMTIDSEEGKGTTVTITLPVAE